MRSRLSVIGSVAAAACVLAALPLRSDASDSWSCPGVPVLCGMTCSPDRFGTPIFCSNGTCTCASGYDTTSTPGGTVCVPTQPEETIGSEGRDSDDFDMAYSCPGICTQDQDHQVGPAVPWATVGSIYKAFDLVPVHGVAPGGEAYMPVWGYQANQCSDHGVLTRCNGGTSKGNICNVNADCPGGSCTGFGVCVGGAVDGANCFTSADCGTCGPLSEGKCENGTREGLQCDCPGGTCDAGLCQGGSDNGHTCNTTQNCTDGGTCVAIGFCVGWNGGQCQTDADCRGICFAIHPGRCTIDGRTCSTDADCPAGTGTCSPARTWAGCSPDPFPFCFGIQESDEGDFNYDNCESTEGAGDCGDVDLTPGRWNTTRSGTPDQLCGRRVSDFTDAWPFLDHNAVCGIGTTYQIEQHGVGDPARIDYPNSVVLYRAPTYWEDFTDNPIDHDYTMDMVSPGHELYDTDTQFIYHHGCSDETHGRVHIEFDRFESVNHFTGQDWGDANAFWNELRCVADPNYCTVGIGGDNRDNTTRCFIKSFVNPTLTCPPPKGADGKDEDVNADCSLHDPIAVVAGVPGLDCADDPYQGTDEIHPVLGLALRIQEDPSKGPEQWTFYYRNVGGNGACGGTAYSRCLSEFKLPLGFPVVPDGKVLTGADVSIDWHQWSEDDTTRSDIKIEHVTTSPVQGHFDLTDGTVLTITLPHFDEGVVGLVTVTPHYDDTVPSITCPTTVNTQPDLGKCTAKVTFPAPTFSDDCSVSAACAPPSGSAFPIGTTTDTCTATDQAGNMKSCNFNVTVTAGNKCPHNAGYWKNHTNWPVNSLMLGGRTYTQAQLLSILKISTTGDASVILASAEIATLLSLANGSNPTSICATVADADAAIGNLLVPANVHSNTALGQRMVSDASSLTSFNNGTLTPGCTP